MNYEANMAQSYWEFMAWLRSELQGRTPEERISFMRGMREFANLDQLALEAVINAVLEAGQQPPLHHQAQPGSVVNQMEGPAGTM
jgi:hypothetical protein